MLYTLSKLCLVLFLNPNVFIKHDAIIKIASYCHYSYSLVLIESITHQLIKVHHPSPIHSLNYDQIVFVNPTPL